MGSMVRRGKCPFSPPTSANAPSPTTWARLFTRATPRLSAGVGISPYHTSPPGRASKPCSSSLSSRKRRLLQNPSFLSLSVSVRTVSPPAPNRAHVPLRDVHFVGSRRLLLPAPLPPVVLPSPRALFSPILGSAAWAAPVLSASSSPLSLSVRAPRGWCFAFLGASTSRSASWSFVGVSSSSRPPPSWCVLGSLRLFGGCLAPPVYPPGRTRITE